VLLCRRFREESGRKKEKAARRLVRKGKVNLEETSKRGGLAQMAQITRENR